MEKNMIEFRFWDKEAARRRYDELLLLGHSCNMSFDGKGVIVKIKLKQEKPNDI